MSKYSVSKRISIVKVYYSSNNSLTAAQRKFATEYKMKATGPSVITIKNVIEKFERSGSVDVSTRCLTQRFLQNFALRLLMHTITPLNLSVRIWQHPVCSRPPGRRTKGWEAVSDNDFFC
ncbi:hypothetical protein AVEN_147882-1 [Araneus ventricosus]|uniref:DUF4817 domain-containing protein n=1 Tax=Araneus ventricosus TaxID=182803 RepID=A0A4Y2UYL4_ARAVE|nr:hypothetical protein AVEN_147882-1 [Araneus ventricosus]